MGSPQKSLLIECPDVDQLVERIADVVCERLAPLLASKPKAVGADELAEQISCSRATVDRLVKSGQIPSMKIGSSRRFVVEEVLRSLKS